MSRRRKRNRNHSGNGLPISQSVYQAILNGRVATNPNFLNEGQGTPNGIVGFGAENPFDEEVVKAYFEQFSALKAQPIPQVQTGLNTLSLLPEPTQDNIVPYPDLSTSFLKDISRNHLAVHMIINMRTTDVLSFASPSQQVWKRGWRIMMRNAALQPTPQDLRDIQDAQSFLEMGGLEYGRDIFARNEYGSFNFSNLLAGMVRDTLTFDGIALYTVRGSGGLVKQFGLFPAEQIRLAQRTYVSTNGEGQTLEHIGGYKGNPKLYAVAVTDTNQVGQAFTRKELYYYRRNVRNEPNNPGYGYSEIAQALSLIESITNAIETNRGVFNRNSIPLAYLKLKGNWNPKQFSFVQRYFQAIARNPQFAYTIPAFKVPAEGDIEVDEISSEIRKAAYTELWNMTFAALSVCYGIPHTRFGYSISGEVKQPKEMPAHHEQNRDFGLIVLLNHLETVINEALIQQRWPRLMFGFTSKTPDEDARGYESRYNSMSYNERRSENDLPSYAEGVIQKIQDFAEMIKKLPPEIRDDAGLMRLAKAGLVLEIMPADPALAGIAQTILSQVVAMEADKTPDKGSIPKPKGARISNKKDPASSRDHGHLPGVRRDSRKEKEDAENK